MVHDVFISYSTQDKSVADAISAVLEGHGLRCWIAPRDVIPGSDWGASIVEAINGSRAMVLVFSSHSNRSPQVKREVERAVNRGIAIIPFRIENVAPSRSLEYFISSQHWLDALTPPLEQHILHLNHTLQVLLGKRTAVPGASRPAASVAPLQTPSDHEKHSGTGRTVTRKMIRETGGWHWPAFCFGPFWYLYKRMVRKGIWLLVLTLATLFLGLPFICIYSGARGKGDWYEYRLTTKSYFNLKDI